MKYNIGDVVYRHGDLILKKTDKAKGKSIPPGGSSVLLQGLNHSHMISGQYSVIKDGDKQYLEVHSTCTLDHKEHGGITIKKRSTMLEIGQQVEYDHFSEESRNVID